MTVVGEAAAGLVLVTGAYQTSRHIINKYYAVGAQLEEGGKHLDDTLDICEKWGSGVKPTDAVIVASTYEMLRLEEKEVEAQNQFLKYLHPRVVYKARQFKDDAVKLLKQTTTLSQDARMGRSILQQADIDDGQTSPQTSASSSSHSDSLNEVLEENRQTAVKRKRDSESSLNLWST